MLYTLVLVKFLSLRTIERKRFAELIHTLIKLKPTAAKGTYVKSIYLSSTMSPGIAIDTKSVN